MLTAVVLLLRSLALICSGHRAVALENLAPRQQLAVFRRTVKRPTVSKRDRLFWVLLANAWRDWRTALIVVHPDTVVRWLCTGTSWPAQYEGGHSDARQPDGRGESFMGRSSDPWGIG